MLGYPVELVSDGQSSSATGDRIAYETPGRVLNDTASLWSALAEGYVHIYPEVREVPTSDFGLVICDVSPSIFRHAD